LAFDWFALVHKDVAAPVLLDRIAVKPQAVAPTRLPKPSIHDVGWYVSTSNFLLHASCRSTKESRHLRLSRPWATALPFITTPFTNGWDKLTWEKWRQGWPQ